MTATLMLLAWVAAGLAVAAFAAVGRRPQAPPCHLLTARQFAAEVGVSVAAVMAWQAEGLVPTVHCGGCAGTIPFDVVARLRTLAVASTAVVPPPGPCLPQRSTERPEADRTNDDGAGSHPDAVPTAR